MEASTPDAAVSTTHYYWNGCSTWQACNRGCHVRDTLVNLRAALALYQWWYIPGAVHLEPKWFCSLSAVCRPGPFIDVCSVAAPREASSCTGASPVALLDCSMLQARATASLCSIQASSFCFCVVWSLQRHAGGPGERTLGREKVQLALLSLALATISQGRQEWLETSRGPSGAQP